MENHIIVLNAIEFQQALKENAKIRETNEKIRRAKEAKERQQKEREAKLARKKALVDMTIGKFLDQVSDLGLSRRQLSLYVF